jgi:hypothetical protein
MMAFELPSHTQLPVLGLAPNLAPVGTRVWVLSKAENSQSTEVDQYPGTVTFSFEVGLTVKLDRPLDAPGSSGAPILDAKNQLVGMMVGTQDNKRINIAAIPSTTIYKRLFTEVGR